MIEQLTTVLATHLHLKREIPKKFNDLRHMVIVFGEQLALTLRVEQVFGSQQFEDLTFTH